MEFKKEVKIPKDRVGVLIGKGGSVKTQIEEKTNTKIKITNDGYVTVEGEDSFKILKAMNTIKAIGRGFDPQTAFKLLKDEYVLDIIDITDYAKTKNSLIRLRGRVIGTKGKAKRTIQELTETDIVIYGKTVGIIGLPENVALAREAVIRLLEGAMHSTVYHFLEKERKKMKIDRLINMWREAE